MPITQDRLLNLARAADDISAWGLTLQKIARESRSDPRLSEAMQIVNESDLPLDHPMRRAIALIELHLKNIVSSIFSPLPVDAFVSVAGERARLEHNYNRNRGSTERMRRVRARKTEQTVGEE